MLCISEVMAGRYLNNRGYLPAYLPVHLTSVSRHFAVAWQPCCRSVAILLLWRGNLVVVAWQSCCCSVAIFRGCSGPRCTNIASDKNLPRNTQNPQNLLADKSLPQISQNSQKLQAEDILPQIAQNTQKLLAEKSLPRISQMYTDF